MPLAFISIAYKDFLAVMNSVFLSGPPKVTFAGDSGISIVFILFPWQQ